MEGCRLGELVLQEGVAKRYKYGHADRLESDQFGLTLDIKISCTSFYDFAI